MEVFKNFVRVEDETALCIGTLTTLGDPPDLAGSEWFEVEDFSADPVGKYYVDGEFQEEAPQ